MPSDSAETAVVQSALPLKLLARGKVRDVYDAHVALNPLAAAATPGVATPAFEAEYFKLNEGGEGGADDAEAKALAESILFLATDRISAFDIILANVRVQRSSIIEASTRRNC